MAARIQVVEPTLASDAGHCAAIFNSLYRVAPDIPYQIWVDRRVQAPSVAATGAVLRPHFFRPLRRLQALPLYRRLLNGLDPIYIPTATYFDLEAVARLCSSQLPADRVFLYFHKWRATPRRRRALTRIAQRQPHLYLLGASPAITQHLSAAGFAHVDTVIPITAEFSMSAPQDIFHHLLFAGAARADKGFTHVVNLAALLTAQASTLPLVVQTTGDHYGRHDQRTRADLNRLRELAYPALRTVDVTPNRLHYAELFAGAICLQPYNRREYAEKSSAITFDALMAGAPIVTLSGTPMAQWVSDFGAGLVVEDARPETLLAAARTIRDNYAAFAARAREAGARLDPKQAWAPVVAAFRRGLERAR